MLVMYRKVCMPYIKTRPDAVAPVKVVYSTKGPPLSSSHAV